jgi:hypothetical protein
MSKSEYLTDYDGIVKTIQNPAQSLADRGYNSHGGA